MESPITAEKVWKGTCFNACLVDKSIGGAPMVSSWTCNMEGNTGDEAWGWGVAQNQKQPLGISHYFLYILFIFWGCKTFPFFRVRSVLRQDNELGRVYGWDNSLALMPYRMWLCVGHAQQHIVLSMQKESPTTAEKVWKWYCLHCLTCLTTYTSCTILYSWYSAYLRDF